MPYAAQRPCTAPGCNELTKSGRCEKHPLEPNQYEQMRGSAASRGYGARWVRLRRMILRKNPLCACMGILCHHHKGKCNQPATDVDHIIAKKHGGLDEPSNLNSLCHQCHSVKTAHGN